MTPSGVETRSIFRPFGRSKLASTRPTGSGRSAISSSPRAIASTRGRIERQPIEERRRRSARLGVRDIERIGGEYGVALAANFAGRCAQRVVLGVAGGERHRPRRRPRGAPERNKRVAQRRVCATCLRLAA